MTYPKDLFKHFDCKLWHLSVTDAEEESNARQNGYVTLNQLYPPTDNSLTVDPEVYSKAFKSAFKSKKAH